MTPALWIAIVGPLLALAGVLLGLWLGQKRWKAEQLQKERTKYDENLKATYLELWDVVEEVHIKMRSGLVGFTAEEFGGLIADVNNFMIRKGLFIERQDRYLVLEYLFWTNEFLRRVVSSKEGRAYVLHSLSSDEMPTHVEELHQISEKAEELRGRLRARIREVIGAPHSDGWNPEEQPSEDLKGKLQQLAEAAEEERERRRSAVFEPPEREHPGGRIFVGGPESVVLIEDEDMAEVGPDVV